MTKVASRWSLGRSLLIVAVSLIIAGGGTGFLVWAHGFSADAAAEYSATKSEVDDAQKARDKVEFAKKRATQALESEKKRVAADEAAWAGRGYSPAGDEVYYKFSDVSTFSCGYWDCAYVELVAVKGCPNSLYVEAAVTSGGADIGLANHLASGVPEYGSVAALLEDFSGQGDGFRVTKVNCY